MATNPNMVAIETVEVGSGGAASIEFTNIPQTYTDLVVICSTRNTGSGVANYHDLYFNGVKTSFTGRFLEGSGSAVSSGTSQYAGLDDGGGATASTFSNSQYYIPNYTSANNKSYGVDSVTENNATTSYMSLVAGLWSNTAAITSVKVAPQTGNFAQYSTATLYGVTSAAVGAKATGGIITMDENYFYHTFASSGTFTPTSNLSCDYLVVAGGGGAGGSDTGSDTGTGGGGAGGFRTATAQSFTSSTAYTITVGAGGSGGAKLGNGTKGSNSSIAGSGFTTFSSTGGGFTNGAYSWGGNNGGSGGGTTPTGTVGTGNEGSYSPSEGNNGAVGATDNVNGTGSGGGGGAGAAGSSPTAGTYNGGNGGIGSYTAISGGATTGAGILSSGNYYFAGGGGGGAGRTSQTKGTGGIGGGGDGGGSGISYGSAGTANTGGGGGGATGQTASTVTGGAGGSGIVIVRYAR